MNDHLLNELPLHAGVYKRAAAYLLDLLVLMPYVGMLAAIGATFPVLRAAFIGAAHAQALQFLLLTAPIAGWFTAWEMLPRGATPGKMLVGLRVLYSRDSQRGFAAVLRNSLKLLPWELNHAAMWHIRFRQGTLDATATMLIALTWLLALIYFFGAVFNREKRTLYDRLSGTEVVEVRRHGHLRTL